MITKAALTAQFGTDAQFGIGYLLDESREWITFAEYDRRWGHLSWEDQPAGESQFPDGSSATVCTNYAIQIARAYPGRVRIMGFANEDNPTSKVAQDELHPGGHDFAILDDRFLIDPWVRLVAGANDVIVFDLTDPQDQAAVLVWYGPQSCWSVVAGAEAEVLQPTP